MSQLIGMVVSVKLRLFSFFMLRSVDLRMTMEKNYIWIFILYLNMFLKGRECGQSDLWI